MATACLRQLLTSAFTAESSIRYSQGSGAVFQQRLTYQNRQGPDLADGPRSLGLILKNIQGTHNSSRNKHQTGLGNRVNECMLLTLAMSQLQEFGQSSLDVDNVCRNNSAQLSPPGCLWPEDHSPTEALPKDIN